MTTNSLSSNDQQAADFSFAITSDVSQELRLRIGRFTNVNIGITPEPNLTLDDDMLMYSELSRSLRTAAEPFIVCQIFAAGKSLSPPIRTAHRCFTAKDWIWNEWISFPIKYCDISESTKIAFTIWDAYAPRKAVPIGGSTFSLLDENRAVKKGKQKLAVWPNFEADGRVYSTTDSTVLETNELDRLERLVWKYELGDIPQSDWMDKLTLREIESTLHDESISSSKMYLYIELPKFDFPLILHEKEYTLPKSVVPFVSNTTHQYLRVYDPEIARGDNPVEMKHRKLARSHRNGPLDRDLKPNAKLRDDINKILQYPPTQPLTSSDSDLLWKFRFYLMRDKKAVTKFLKSVVWSDVIESRQAVELLNGWIGIDTEDALELLGTGFENESVRGYAVDQLRKADDDVVQALKFEHLSTTTINGNDAIKIQDSQLAKFLIERAVQNRILGNYFYWYLNVECEDKKFGQLYSQIVSVFMNAMISGPVAAPDGPIRKSILRRQTELIKTLARICKEMKLSKDSRPKKIELLRNIISDPKNGLSSFSPLPLPLDAQVIVTGLIADKCTIFKSSLLPLRLTFSCADSSEYQMMFKMGDDLRQDQLVLQLFTLMDRLLRKENLDLKLTSFKVLATGADHGMVQFVPSSPLATILSEFGNSLTAYLKANNPDVDVHTLVNGIPTGVMDTYVKSCAGYCVITYLLGIGDRHLDNLLLTASGNLFHIDFGYILGRDPKPFPPPMKLSKEMVDVMGGASSPQYQNFKSYCFVAFNSLRKNANLILNLFALMVDANIPDIRVEPDKAVLKVQEKFRLDLNEEEAIQYFQGLINESIGAMFPQVMERIHGIAMMFRS
ncbi:Phosphatidylinositol (PI) 3-kinase [Physocladia obscura]|uniref:Phosphatidylinositol 3-kinase VPS34 n=1 Tax=Physocladia obscura TaxID=109957 RepID=A0AAD5T1M2_9FUNG|nr:Phosphatidylinositol (PI) 3-kinase [Physocladia obscura]